MFHNNCHFSDFDHAPAELWWGRLTFQISKWWYILARLSEVLQVPGWRSRPPLWKHIWEQYILEVRWRAHLLQPVVPTSPQGIDARSECLLLFLQAMVPSIMLLKPLLYFLREAKSNEKLASFTIEVEISNWNPDNFVSGRSLIRSWRPSAVLDVVLGHDTPGCRDDWYPIIYHFQMVPWHLPL